MSRCAAGLFAGQEACFDCIPDTACPRVIWLPTLEHPPCQFSTAMKYGLRLANPLPFFAEQHRPAHFLDFSSMEAAAPEADIENPFE